jgi:fructose-1,6-bisphosphatase I
MLNVTLNQYLQDRQQQLASLTPELSQLILQLSTACKSIDAALVKGALAGHLGSADSDNVQGEEQKKLDVLSNTILIDTVLNSGTVAGVASEEMEDMIPGNNNAKYLLMFDPLDGSSNIDINMAVGTIFSILPYSKTGIEAGNADFLQNGRHQVAAGYVLYGPSTILVLTLGDGVDSFTLNHEVGEFILTEEGMQIPADTKEFAINSSNSRFWEAPVKRYIDECCAGKTGPLGKDFNMRWVACMVGDIHRILTRGGIFMYPYDTKDPNKAGRLRLMYEANPLGMLIEQAGGLVSTGRQPILEVEPNDLHQRIPVILGSKNEVQRVVDYHSQAN